MQPAQALHHLRYTNKEPARHLYKAIQSALSNAKLTLNTSEDLLQFKVLTVEEGRKLKRFRAGGRGMAKPYVHKYSHIKVVITARDAGAAKATPAKSIVKTTDQSKEKTETEETKKEQARPKVAAPRETRMTGQRVAVKQRTVTRQKKG